MKEKLVKLSENIYELPAENGMLVPARIFVSPALLKNVDDSCLGQLVNASKMPGIMGAALGMSDVHVGYGLPIGGVIAFDSKDGVISPEAVGYDINCGVRLLRTDLSFTQVEKKKEALVNELFKTIPSGNGHLKYIDLSKKDIDEILDNGMSWAKEKGFASLSDCNLSEDEGRIKKANSKFVSQEAKRRGMSQIGTLGAGNHFLEVQRVEKIFDAKVAKAFGLKKDMVCIMIHSGSRGLGHQVADEYIKKMRDKNSREMMAFAPIKSEIGQRYLGAMSAAANFAFVNRQLMTHAIREVFDRVFANGKVELVYDLTHNIAKMENLVIGDKKLEVCVHRKGATRSFGAGRKELPLKYRSLGSPIFIPGSMGTASFVMVGTHKAEEISLASAPHGAGRVISRTNAMMKFKPVDVRKGLEKKGIILRARSEKGISEEAPEVYKDVDEVVRVTKELGIAKIVAKLKPIVVIKG
ncbi:MAG: RtcB family protein [Nanoarchaeota archaeon]